MTHFAREYGGALFSLAGKEGLTDEIMDQLREFDKLLEQQPEYLRLLASRAIDASERKGLLDEALRGRVHDYLLNFLKILIDRGTIANVGECIDAYTKLYNEMYNIETAKVVSATVLTDAQKETVRAKLENMTGKTVIAQYSTDPSLIGGLRVEIAGKRYDNTISTRLSDLKYSLMSKQ